MAEYSKLSTEEDTPTTNPLSSSTNIPSFVVPTTTAIPSPSPLLIPSHSLPLKVSSSILNTLSKEVQPTQEHVVYCEPPRKCNGLKSGSFLFVIFLAIGIATAFCTYRVLTKEPRGENYYFYEYGTEDDYEMKHHLHSLWSLFAVVPTLYLAVFLARFEFFAYRVVTNHRAALVIPSRHMLFFPATSRSVYFRPTLQTLMGGSMRENYYTIGSKIAALFYQKNKMGGQAIIFGEKKPLNFGTVSDLKLLDDALSGAIHAAATYAGIKMGTEFKLREEGSFPSSRHEQLLFRTELGLLFMIPFFLIAGSVTLFVLKCLAIFQCNQLLAAMVYGLFILPPCIASGIKIRKQRLSIENQRAVFLGTHPVTYF